MDITSPTVDRSQADGQTAARSQQQKAAAVQKAVAARKQRYLACAFPKLHVVAINAPQAGQSADNGNGRIVSTASHNAVDRYGEAVSSRHAPLM